MFILYEWMYVWHRLVPVAQRNWKSTVYFCIYFYYYFVIENLCHMKTHTICPPVCLLGLYIPISIVTLDMSTTNKHSILYTASSYTYKISATNKPLHV